MKLCHLQHIYIRICTAIVQPSRFAWRQIIISKYSTCVFILCGIQHIPTIVPTSHIRMYLCACMYVVYCWDQRIPFAVEDICTCKVCVCIHLCVLPINVYIRALLVFVRVYITWREVYSKLKSRIGVCVYL